MEDGKITREGELKMTTKPEDLALLTRKREGQQGPFSDQVTLKTAYCRALSNAEAIRKGKGRGKGKGLDAIREDRPLDQQMLKTTFSTIRLKCSKSNATFARRTTLRGPTSARAAPNGWPDCN